MKQFMLLMRGNQAAFLNMSIDEQQKVIDSHIAWSEQLAKLNILIDGNGFSNRTVMLRNAENQLVTSSQPYIDSDEELSGYYIIQCENMDKAVEIAKACPALNHNESVEVIPLGH